MNRRPLLASLAASALLPRIVRAQTPTRTARVGVLLGAGSEGGNYALEAFRLGLRNQGFVDGRNIAYERRIDSEGTEASLARLAEELAGQKLDVALVANTPPVMALRRAAPALPIVMLAAGDPVGSGLVESLARPGGTVTGLTGLDAELTGKRLELLKEVVPGTARVGLLASPDNPVFAVQLRNAEAAARAHGVELLREDVHAVSELDRAFANIVERKGTAVLRLDGFRSKAALQRLAELNARHRLPFCSDRLPEVQAGLLMSFGPNTASAFRQAAGFVAKILHGAKPAELAVESPAKFELAVNLATAKALGIVFPASVLARANAVIEA
ncbi:MAG: ABC transporter substrate-binding protein [Reyranellales bacterium]